MAIEFRDVTQLEPLEALEDGDYLVVVRDGVAKRISKADAKFGGGSSEKIIFYVGKETATRKADSYVLYKDAACTNLAIAQEVYDAFTADNAKFILPGAGDGEFVLEPCMFAWQDENAGTENPTAVDGVLLVFFVGAALSVECGDNPPIFAG